MFINSPGFWKSRIQERFSQWILATGLPRSQPNCQYCVHEGFTGAGEASPRRGRDAWAASPPGLRSELPDSLPGWQLAPPMGWPMNCTANKKRPFSTWSSPSPLLHPVHYSASVSPAILKGRRIRARLFKRGLSKDPRMFQRHRHLHSYCFTAWCPAVVCPWLPRACTLVLSRATADRAPAGRLLWQGYLAFHL